MKKIIYIISAFFLSVQLTTAQEEKFFTLQDEVKNLDSLIIFFPHLFNPFTNVEYLMKEGKDAVEQSDSAVLNIGKLQNELSSLSFIRFLKKRKIKKRINELQIISKESSFFASFYYDTSYFITRKTLSNEIEKYDLFIAENQKNAEKLVKSSEKNSLRAKQKIFKYLEFLGSVDNEPILEKSNWNKEQKEEFKKIDYKRFNNNFNSFQTFYRTSFEQQYKVLKICLQDKIEYDAIQKDTVKFVEEETEDDIYFSDADEYVEETVVYKNPKKEVIKEEEFIEEEFIEDDEFSPECNDRDENMGIIYSIQIMALSKPIPNENQQNLYNKCKVLNRINDNMYKYSVGRFFTYQKAKEFKKLQISSKGIKGAFIVAFNKNGEQIHEIQEAISITDDVSFH